MIEWFIKLTVGNKIAIVVPVGLAAIGGLFGLFKWCLGRKGGPSAGADVNTSIRPDDLLDRYATTLRQLGQSEERIANQQATIRQLEEELAQPQRLTDVSPQPTQEAKELAAQIEDEAGPYARALKAIADGNDEQADDLLDETQQFLDAVQEAKDRAQVKIYMARMQNAVYAGRHRDALRWCDSLEPLAGENPHILSNLARVYHENTLYQKAEALMRKALGIDEASLGPDHPDVAVEINDLAQLLQVTDRLSEAEPLMRRALQINEASLGLDHPDVAVALNNLAALFRATNRLSEAEPLMRRALEIDEASFGPDHPDVAIRLNNMAQLLQDTNHLSEAEPLMRRVVRILENPAGDPLPDYAGALNNLAQLLMATNRLSEAEPLMKRQLEILLQFTRETGHRHPHLEDAINNYTSLLRQMGHSQNEVRERMKRLAPEMFDDAAKKAEHCGEDVDPK